MVRELEIRPLIARRDDRRMVLVMSDGSDHKLSFSERLSYALSLTDERKLERKLLKRRRKAQRR